MTRTTEYIPVIKRCGDTDDDGDCPRCINKDWRCPKTVERGSDHFTNQEPFFVVPEDARKPWGGDRSGRRFVCGMCLRKFVAGDIARWVMVSGAPNTFVCQPCDGPNVAIRFKQHWDEVIVPILKRWSGDYD